MITGPRGAARPAAAARAARPVASSDGISTRPVRSASELAIRPGNPPARCASVERLIRATSALDARMFEQLADRRQLRQMGVELHGSARSHGETAGWRTCIMRAVGLPGLRLSRRGVHASRASPRHGTDVGCVRPTSAGEGNGSASACFDDLLLARGEARRAGAGAKAWQPPHASATASTASDAMRRRATAVAKSTRASQTRRRWDTTATHLVDARLRHPLGDRLRALGLLLRRRRTSAATSTALRDATRRAVAGSSVFSPPKVKISFVPSHAFFVPSPTLRALALTGASGSAGIFGISILGIVILGIVTFGILSQPHGRRRRAASARPRCRRRAACRVGADCAPRASAATAAGSMPRPQDRRATFMSMPSNLPFPHSN